MAAFNIDPSISLGVKPPAAIGIGDIMNIARGAQAYKQAQETYPDLARAVKAQAQSAEQTAATGDIDLQVKQQSNQERLALQDFFKNPDNYQTDGQFDLGKVNATVPQIAPLTGPKYIETMTSLNKSQTDANVASQDFSQKTRGIVGGALGILGRMNVNDPAVYISELTRLKDGAPQDKALAKYADSQIEFIKKLPPGSNLAQGAVVHAEQLLTPESQYGKFAPQAGTVDTGQSIYQTVTQPSVGGAAPSVETMPKPIVNKQLPIGTKYVAEPGDNSGREPGTELIVGPAGTAVPANGQPNQPSKPLATSTSPAFQQRQKMASTDFEEVSTKASTAQRDIGILEEIKRLAPTAVTGAAAGRRELALKWGSLLNLSKDDLAATDADLLKKESNMLAQAGNTDAARVLTEMSNPNYKMTKEAIIKASNQIIAQKKLMLLEQGVKKQYQGDADTYIKVKDQLDRIKDPRALEFVTMDKPEQANLWAALKLDAKGKALPLGSDGMTDAQRDFKKKVDALIKLDKKFNLGLTP